MLCDVNNTFSRILFCSAIHIFSYKSGRHWIPARGKTRPMFSKEQAYHANKPTSTSLPLSEPCTHFRESWGCVNHLPPILGSVLPWSDCSALTEFTQHYAWEVGNNSQAVQPPRFAKHLWARSFTYWFCENFVQVRMILPGFTLLSSRGRSCLKNFHFAPSSAFPLQIVAEGVKAFISRNI